ncbi:MAG: hypothetical protein V4615_14910 [Bacteroidota bacterium]
MALRLVMGGISSPLQLRHESREKIKRACKSIVGDFWHYRLNFMEVDLRLDKQYKTMQAMRQISAGQRASIETLNDILYALCLQLERRMMTQGVFCHSIGFSCSYKSGFDWSDHIHTDLPIQGGIDLREIIIGRMNRFEESLNGERVMNNDVGRMSIWVAGFVQSGLQQYSMFESTFRKDKLRKSVYNIRDKFGFEKVQTAAELLDKPVMKDVIGFGSIKDLSSKIYEIPVEE